MSKRKASGQLPEDLPAREPPQLPGKRRLVIGIDTGTTRYVVAWAVYAAEDSHNPEDHTAIDIAKIRLFKEWPGSYAENNSSGPQHSFYPPSALLYDKSTGMATTGHEMMAIVQKKHPKVDFDRYFLLWKLMFHDHMGDATTKRIQEHITQKLNLLGKTKENLVRDWVGFILSHTICEDATGTIKMESILGEPLSNFDVQIIVTVPPGRGVIDHTAIFNAYVQQQIKAHQVFLVSEPEAMFRYWVALMSKEHHWETGKTYLVADGGGGTCCWVRYRLVRLNPPGFVQECASTSIVCGSETISDDFVQLADAKLPRNFRDRNWILNRMRHNFDKDCKHMFGNVSSRVDYFDDFTEIKFEYREIVQCFEHCASRLIKGTEYQLKQGGRPTDYIIVGGGLFANPFILDKVRSAFRNISTIIEVENDKQHVAKGAVLTRVTSEFKNFVVARTPPLSHAVITRVEVDRSIKTSPLYKYLRTHIDPQNKRQYYQAAQWLVKQTQEVPTAYELASESTYATARTRGIELESPELDFEEQIISVDYNPGNAIFTPLGKNGDTLIDNEGNPVGGTFKEVTPICWNPQNLGIDLQNLEYISKTKIRQGYRKIRYSIQLRCEVTHTNYWIKAWAEHSKAKNKSRYGVQRAIFSEPVRSIPLLSTQNLSESLDTGFKLGSGIPESDSDSEDGPAVDLEPRRPARKSPWSKRRNEMSDMEKTRQPSGSRKAAGPSTMHPVQSFPRLMTPLPNIKNEDFANTIFNTQSLD